MKKQTPEEIAKLIIKYEKQLMNMAKVKITDYMVDNKWYRINWDEVYEQRTNNT